MSDWDVIVIGAGAAGASSALELARRGKKVLLLEQFSVPHERGSSGGHSRIFRFAYDEPDYARLAMHSLGAWQALERELGMSLYTRTGGLDLGPAGNPSLERTAQTMQEVGAEFERLDALELHRRFPQWRVPDGWCALHSFDAGILEPMRAVEAMVALARAYGATLLEHTAVQSIDLEHGAVMTARGIFAADRIVVSAGAWLPELLPELRLPLEVTLESVLFFRPRQPERFTPERFPIFIEHEDLAYGFPSFGLPGVKLGLHQSGPQVTASTRTLEVPPGALERAQNWLEAKVPGQGWTPIQARTCLYTNTPGHDFLIDHHPHSSAVLLVSPCSGHGFKFAPFLGQMIADRLEGTPNPFDLPRFRLERVGLGGGEGRLLSRTEG